MKNQNKFNRRLIALPLIVALILLFTAATCKGEYYQGEEGKIYGETIHCDYDRLVLIIAGSGPTDRNGNTPVLEGRNDSLKLLARELENNGISTFRYDKRTAGKSREIYLNTIVSFDSFISDAVSAVEYLKGKGYKRIYLLGHSQGSLIAIEAAKKTDVAGLISLCGPSERIDLVLENQFKDYAERDSIEIKVINRLRKGNITNEDVEDHPVLNIKNQIFLLSWMKYSPMESIKNVRCPLLIVNGLMDSQVGIKDLENLVSANPKSESRTIDGMNHVLKIVSSEIEDARTYTDPSYPVSKELVQTILGFIEK